MLAALVAIVLNGFGLVRPRPGIGLPLRGHGAAHDWLLVVDSEADRLAVYAIDGRPLGQLDADAAAAMLGRHDGRVLVIAGDGTRDRPALPPPRITGGDR